MAETKYILYASLGLQHVLMLKPFNHRWFHLAFSDFGRMLSDGAIRLKIGFVLAKKMGYPLIGDGQGS